MPKLDHSKVFEAVLDKFKQNNAVGILPEGRSHETPGVIKFKSGIGQIIYAAYELKIPLQVYALGINYSDPQIVTPNQYICISESISFEQEINLADKKASIKQITLKMQNELSKMVVPMKNYDEVKMVYYIYNVFYREKDGERSKK